jgi:hypothetical protein
VDTAGLGGEGLVGARLIRLEHFELLVEDHTLKLMSVPVENSPVCAD